MEVLKGSNKNEEVSENDKLADKQFFLNAEVFYKVSLFDSYK